MSSLSDINWGSSPTSNVINNNQSNLSNNKVDSNSNQPPVINLTSASSSNSGYPIDNIPNNLDEDSLKERVDAVVKVQIKIK